MALPDLMRWAECWLELQGVRNAALAAGATLRLAQSAEAAGSVGQTWGRFALGWDAELLAVGAEAEHFLREVHRLSGETDRAFFPERER